MQYLDELVALENEWQDIKISGDEYVRAINENPDLRENKKRQLLSYRDQILSSGIADSEKERKLKDIKDNLGYLEEKTPKNTTQASGDRQLLTGILLGGLITVLGMYFMDSFKDSLKKSLSEGVLDGLYSGMRKQRI